MTNHNTIFLPNNARAMGADPTASSVTGKCSTVELRPHPLACASKFHPIKLLTKCRVPAGGVAPPSRVYESLVLTLELHRLYRDSSKNQSIRTLRQPVD